MTKQEQILLDKIVYIGNEIPESLCTDKRNKFVLLGTPAELIEQITTLLEKQREEYVEMIEKYFKNRAINPKMNEQIFWSDVNKDVINLIKSHDKTS